MSLIKTRNSTIDTVRIIAAFLVVFIHLGRTIGIEHGGITGYVTQTIYSVALIALPLFFCISGYYLYNKKYEIVTQKAKKQIWKLLKIFVVWQIIWFLFSSFVTSDILTQINSVNFESIFNVVVFNKPMFGGLVLWFILALLYVYFIFLLNSKYIKNDAIVFIFGTAGYIFGLAIGTYYQLFSISQASTDLMVINWLAYGLIFFSTGYYIAKNSTNLLKTNNKKLILSTCVLVLIYGIEQFILLKVNGSLGITTITMPAVLAGLLIMIIKWPNLLDKSRIPIIGASCALYIYLLHVFIKRIIYKVADTYDLYIGTNILWVLGLTIFTFLLSLVIAIITVKLKSRNDQRVQFINTNLSR